MNYQQRRRQAQSQAKPDTLAVERAKILERIAVIASKLPVKT